MSYNLVAIKKRWVPEWLWRMLGQLPLKQPLRRWLTTDNQDAMKIHLVQRVPKEKP